MKSVQLCMCIGFASIYQLGINHTCSSSVGLGNTVFILAERELIKILQSIFKIVKWT